jgi:hypothetical protein
MLQGFVVLVVVYDEMEKDLRIVRYGVGFLPEPQSIRNVAEWVSQVMVRVKASNLDLCSVF